MYLYIVSGLERFRSRKQRSRGRPWMPLARDTAHSCPKPASECERDRSPDLRQADLLRRTTYINGTLPTKGRESFCMHPCRIWVYMSTRMKTVKSMPFCLRAWIATQASAAK
ncbi:hypothetical protein DPMN_092589 [Dreissena polymorpha]|uniref:Uncharacterized protein n=1 Tax=Dreissena polymorpha TaxID=45954 RepID=A0A9D4R118_DREPO|nr:hypothetical protein DPMN_092589 [Dreissena polymorpha]